jgi:two-component system phosphate regulon sensor histidine kinase PhoR
MLRIGEVTALAGVSAGRLRSWERAGLFATLHALTAGADANGDRRYTVEHVAHTRLFRRLFGMRTAPKMLCAVAERLRRGELRPEARDYEGIVNVAGDGDEDVLRQVVEALAELVVCCDRDGVITYINPAMHGFLRRGHALPFEERLAGHDGDEVGGPSFPFEDLPLRHVALSGEPRFNVEVTQRSSDGTWRLTVWNVVPLYKPEGAGWGAAAVGRDVTEETVLAPAREEWLAITAHQLRGPITVILGNLQLAKQTLDMLNLSEEAVATPRGGDEMPITLPVLARLAHNVAVAEARMRDLVLYMETLLEASTVVAGRLELRPEPDGVALTDMLREVVGHTRDTAPGRRIALDVPEEPLIVAGDALRLREVFDNVLANAVKYAPDGQHIVIRAARAAHLPASAPQPALAGSTATENGGHTPAWALLAVEDDGLGIPERDVPHVFERYRRAGGAAARIRGTGLGLYTCRAIVEAHGGVIWIERTSTGEEAKDWRGTVVALALPLAGRMDERNVRE